MRSFAQKGNKLQRPVFARPNSATPGMYHRAPDLQRVMGNQAALRQIGKVAQQHEQLLDAHVGSGDVAQAAVPPIVGDVVHSSGVPLEPAIRAGAEARLGFDFSRVRIHTDETAARSADAVGARAYTVGLHIAFARGEYQPQTPKARA
jgi:hypothetical protein